MANLIYKKREDFALAGSIEEFLDLILYREISYFDRTNTIFFGNHFVNYYGDPSVIQPSSELNFDDIVNSRLDTLFETLGDKKLLIILDDKLPSFYVVDKLNKRPEIDLLIEQKRIYIVNKYSISSCSNFIKFLKIPEMDSNGNCFDDDSILYLTFNKGNNLLNIFMTNNILDVDIFIKRYTSDIDSFKQQYNNDSRFELLDPIIAKCPVAIDNVYKYLWWLNLCLNVNYFQSLLFSNITNTKVNFNTIFSFFTDDRFLQNSFHRLNTENIHSIVNQDYICFYLIENYPDMIEFRGYPYKRIDSIQMPNQITLYDDGTIE